MRSESVIGPREVELSIFQFLSSGCATYAEINAALEEAFSNRTRVNSEDCMPSNLGDISSENQVKDDKEINRTSRLSDKSLFKTLSLLRKNKLIQSCRYFDREKSRNFTLYANTENSIEILIRECDYRHDHIRSPYLPGRFAFWHDMDLTKVVRTLKRDEPIYSCRFGFKDELALRQSAPKKTTKGSYYPDLELDMRNRNGDRYVYRIEIQRHRQRVDDFAHKLSKTRNNLVLCQDQRLIGDISDTHIYVNALFAVIDDFFANGLFKSHWMSFDGRVVGLRYTTV